MENDTTTTTTTEPVGSTSNPQASTDGALGASEAAPFQQSAGMDSLKENRAIQVQPTGKAIESTPKNNDMSFAAIVFIVVSSIALVMVASTVFRWVMKRPDVPKKKAPNDLGEAKSTKSKSKDEKVEPDELAKKLQSAGVSAKKNKKKPRSKRGKK